MLRALSPMDYYQTPWNVDNTALFSLLWKRFPHFRHSYPAEQNSAVRPALAHITRFALAIFIP